MDDQKEKALHNKFIPLMQHIKGALTSKTGDVILGVTLVVVVIRS